MPWHPPVTTAAETGDNDVVIMPTPSQHRMIFSPATIVAAYSSFGEGKCLSFGTPLLMADGLIKMVQDVEVGDELMGDDSTPRRVLSLARGTDLMYTIVPKKGDSFTVNQAHILVLQHTNTREILEISVKEFLQFPPWRQTNYKLFHVPVDFPELPVVLPPYLVGLWLGDGTATAPHITTPDAEIVEYLAKAAILLDLEFRTIKPSRPSKADTYSLARKGAGPNWFSLGLRNYGLMPEKFIPYAYKCNSRDVRLGMLAGLIDSDGWVNRSGYQITQKRQQLAEDIVYLARSLGLQSTMRPVKARIQSMGFEGDYFRIYINGDCSAIPVKVAHKKVPQRRQITNPLVTGIKDIRAEGLGDYYGFTLDGNHRFLLGDFLVSHNTFGHIMGMIWHAKRNGVPLQAAIIRDTHENNKHTVVKAFNAFFQRTAIEHQWKNDNKYLTIFHTHAFPQIDVDLLGIDDLASLVAIQGGQYGLIWLEEVVAYTTSSEANAGISEDVFNAALVRCARQEDVKARLQLSFNTPDEDHWATRRIINAPDGMIHPSTPLITKETIFIPPGENIHLKEEARQAAMAAYIHDPVAYARFVKGEVATKYAGLAVTGRAFAPHWHVAPMPLEPVEGMTGWVGWDSWMHPAAVIGQQFPDGRLWVLDVFVDAIDIRDLIRNYVNPLLHSPRWKDKCFGWRQIGDRTMAQPDQSNHGDCARDVCEEEFDPGINTRIPFEPGPQTWAHLYTGLMHALRDTAAGGQPKVLLDPARTKPLIAGLKGRWHFPVNKAGRPTQITPLKDAASHPCDAWANAVCVLAPWTYMNNNQYQKRRFAPVRKLRRVASSYNTRVDVVI